MNKDHQQPWRWPGLAFLVWGLAAFGSVAERSAFAQSVPLADPIAPQSTPSQETFTDAQETIKAIEVKGSSRVDPKTILTYLPVKVGDAFSEDKANTSIKQLFETGFFTDVKVLWEQGTFTIVVTERATISTIAFEGNDKLEDEDLEAEITLKSRHVFSRTAVQKDVNRLLDIYNRNGRFSAKVEPKIIKLPNNRVNLVFEIEEGERTVVDSIVFVGNTYSDDGDLKEEIRTQEDRWYRFLSDNDIYDPDRINFDQELLRQHYTRNGFYDFRVTSAVGQYVQGSDNFIVTFVLEEGPRYILRNFNIISQISDIDTYALAEEIGDELEVEEWYNQRTVDNAILQLKDLLSVQGYPFADVSFSVEKLQPEENEPDQIDMSFVIKPGPKNLIERIDIRGNSRTVDDVIRRELLVVEGDSFDRAKLTRSQENLQLLRYFSKVEVSVKPGEKDDHVVVDIDVEEKKTGEISLSAGYSTDSEGIGTIGLGERNLLGKGYRANVSFQLSRNTQRYDIIVTDPYFLDQKIAGSVNLIKEKTVSDVFDVDQHGGYTSLDYGITDYLSQNIEYGLIDRADTNRSTQVKTDTVYSGVKNRFSYDRRNSRINPTEGYLLSVTNTFAGVGGTTKYIKAETRNTYYHNLLDGYVASITGSAGAMTDWDNTQIAIYDRFRLGGAGLRGFKDRGAGPRSIVNNIYLGGLYSVSKQSEITFPLGLPNELGIKGAFFVDAGVITGTHNDGNIYNDIRDSRKIRSSTGFGIRWVSPLGPLRIDFGFPLTKEDYDKTEIINFNVGTSF